MKLNSLSLATSLIFALSISAFADEFDDFDSDENAISTQSNNSNESSYDGSSDSEFADDEQYAAAYARYKAEVTKQSDIDRQRSEGFSKAIQLGFRASGGINTFFGKKNSGWGLGFNGGAGLVIKMPLGLKDMSFAPELTFNYRHYTYEQSTDFGKDDAEINIMSFEIPLMLRYTFEDYGFYVGAALNLSLKLKGSSEYNQNFDEGATVTDNNALVTSSMELGGVLDLGLMVSRNINIDIRAFQSFNNMLNQHLVPEGRFQEANLMTFYTTLGINFLF